MRLSFSASSASGLSTRFHLQIEMIAGCDQSFGTPQATNAASSRERFEASAFSRAVSLWVSVAGPGVAKRAPARPYRSDQRKLFGVGREANGGEPEFLAEPLAAEVDELSRGDDLVVEEAGQQGFNVRRIDVDVA